MNCEYCGVDNTETRIIKSKYGTLCRKHYLQMYKYGKIKRTIYDRNEIIIHDDYAEIVLRDKEQNIIGSAEIDIEDIDKVKDFKWHIKNQETLIIQFIINKENQFLCIKLYLIIMVMKILTISIIMD